MIIFKFAYLLSTQVVLILLVAVSVFPSDFEPCEPSVLCPVHSEHHPSSVQRIALAGRMSSGHFAARLHWIHGAVSVWWCKHCTIVSLHVYTFEFVVCLLGMWSLNEVPVIQDDSREVLEVWRERLVERGISVVISGHSSAKPRGGNSIWKWPWVMA